LNKKILYGESICFDLNQLQIILKNVAETNNSFIFKKNATIFKKKLL